MKEITLEEFEHEIKNPETGWCTFMQGVHSRNGRDIIAVKDHYFLFEAGEIDSAEYAEKIREQNKEASDYIKGIKDNRPSFSKEIINNASV